MDFVSLLLSGQQLKIKNENSGLPVWTNLSPISADITSPTETTEYPQSGTAMQIVSVSGNSSVNNMQASKVIMPAHLVLHVVTVDQSTIESIISLFSNTELTFSVLTRNIIADGMSLVDVEIEQAPENLNGVGMALTFEQTSLSNQNSFDPRQQADESSVGVSVKEPQGLTGTVTAVYNKVKSSVGF